MVPMPPAAPVNTMRRAGSLTSAILGSFHEVAVALQQARQVFAHRPPRMRRTALGNRRHDTAVLRLDEREGGVSRLDGRQRAAPFARRVNRQPHALTWNDVAAQEGEKARELPIAGGFGDGAMEGEVFGDGALADLQRAVDGAPCRADG